MHKKILCVVTSNNVKGAAGFEYVLASIKGGKPPIDGDSLDFSDPINENFEAMPIFKPNSPTRLNLTTQQPISTRYFLQAGTEERGGIVAAVCHEPAALVNVKLSDGKFLIIGQIMSQRTENC